MNYKYSKRIFILLILSFFSISVFAATTDLAIRFLDKANEAYEDGNIEDAYKYVNQALAVAKDEESQTNIIYFAQTVYKAKLQKIQEKYDDMAFIDIKQNLEKYPSIENTTIKKLVNQIQNNPNLSGSESNTKDGDIDSYVISVGFNINLLKINETQYFSFYTDVSATILEILPIDENTCKMVVAVPWNRAGSFQNYVIYLNKGDLLQTMTSSQVAIGLVKDFQYNKITFLGVAQ